MRPALIHNSHLLNSLTPTPLMVALLESVQDGAVDAVLKTAWAMPLGADFSSELAKAADTLTLRAKTQVSQPQPKPQGCCTIL